MARAAAFDTSQQHRRSLIGKVHVAKKELGLDDDTYRSVLARVILTRPGSEPDEAQIAEAAKTASAADMSEAQLVSALDHFKQHGFKARPRSGSRVADHPSARKARAMWISLYQLGVVHNRSEKALEAFAAKQLGCEQLQWARQSDCFRLIEALKDMAERNGWPQRGPKGEKLTVEQLQAGLRAAIAAKAEAA